MTGPKGNSEFCFPETLNVEVEAGKQNSLFPVRPVIKCFVVPPNSTSFPGTFPWLGRPQAREKGLGTSLLPTQNWKKLRRNRLLYGRLLINLPRFQGARPDHVRVESSCCCFPRELMSFDPRHVTRSPPIAKRIWVERYNKSVCQSSSVKFTSRCSSSQCIKVN